MHTTLPNPSTPQPHQPTLSTSANPDSQDLREQYRAERRLSQITLLRAQRHALEQLMEVMDDPKLTGDSKKDALVLRERNRKRLAATQTLLHCRTMAREERMAKAARAKRRARIAKENTKPRRPAPTPAPVEAPASPPSPSPEPAPPAMPTVPLNGYNRYEQFLKLKAEKTAADKADPPSPLAGEGGSGSLSPGSGLGGRGLG